MDSSCLFDTGESPTPAVLRTVRATPNMPRQVYILPFQLLFADGWQEKCGVFARENNQSEVVDFNELPLDWASLSVAARTLFADIRTLSAKEDIHRSLHLQLLQTLAGLLKSTKIMLPATSTELAARLLAAVAQGKGRHIPNETNYLDKRQDGITLINCMREFTPKECTYYLRQLGVEPITVVSHATLADPIVGSIGRLTDTFISGLQAGFSSTVSTVMKTAAKLQPLRNAESSCSLCGLPLPPVADLCADFGSLCLDGKFCQGCAISLSESGSFANKFVSRDGISDIDEFLIK